MRRILVTLLAAALAASAAQAQRAPDPIKQARAEALVAASKSQGVWRADVAGGITHIASGLTCNVTDSTTRVVELIVHPTPAEGVGCRYEDLVEKTTFVLTVYANHWLTREQLLADAAAPIRTAHPDWKESEPPKDFAIKVTDDKTGEDLTPVATRFAMADHPKRFPRSGSARPDLGRSRCMPPIPKQSPARRKWVR